MLASSSLMKTSWPIRASWTGSIHGCYGSTMMLPNRVALATTDAWDPVMLGEKGALEYWNHEVGRAALRGIPGRPGCLVAVALDHGDYDNGFISYIELWRVP